MLKRLVIQDIAIVDHLSVPFQGGLTVVTGETGAGKSLLVDCLTWVFGQRGSAKTWVKHGAARGRVEVAFARQPYEKHPTVEQVMTDIGLELWPEDQELIFVREMSASSSRYRFNGVGVSRDQMIMLRDVFLQTVGQHEVHDLFSSVQQRQLLDQLGGQPIDSIKQTLRQIYEQWRQACQELDALMMQAQDRDKQLDWVRFQLDEITQAQLVDPLEDEHLKHQRDALANQEDLIKASATIHGMILGTDDPDQPSVLTQLNRLQRVLHPVSKQTTTGPMATWQDQLRDMEAQLHLIAQEAMSYKERLECSPEDLDRIVERLDVLEKLKRKYGPSLETVIKTAVSLEQELEGLETSDQRLQDLLAQRQTLRTQYDELAQTLSELRQGLAQQLVGSLQAIFTQLQLPYAQFEVAFQSTAPSADGVDGVTFLFSANPGDPIKPIQQIASGGELARILLALKVINPVSQEGGQPAIHPVIVLDEADTGMSGLTLRAVAEQLVQLSERMQLIVVTHQPIVAAQGQHHVHVIKGVTPEGVKVQVQTLATPQERAAVLSRLASGLEQGDNQGQAATAFIEALMQSKA